MIKQQNDEKNSQMKENNDKTETKMEDYNLLKILKNKCIDLKNRYIGVPCNCKEEQRVIYEQLCR